LNCTWRVLAQLFQVGLRHTATAAELLIGVASFRVWRRRRYPCNSSPVTNFAIQA
jgi:hypothetical protein